MRMPHHGIHAAKGGRFSLLRQRIYTLRTFLSSPACAERRVLRPQPFSEFPENHRQVKGKCAQHAQSHRTHWMLHNKEIAQAGGEQRSGCRQHRKKRNSQQARYTRHYQKKYAYVGCLKSPPDEMRAKSNSIAMAESGWLGQSIHKIFSVGRTAPRNGCKLQLELEPFLGAVRRTEKILWMLLRTRLLSAIAILFRSLHFIRRLFKHPTYAYFFWYAVYLGSLTAPLLRCWR